MLNLAENLQTKVGNILKANPTEMTWPHSGSSRKYNVYIWPMIWDIRYIISKTSDQIRALERCEKHAQHTATEFRVESHRI